MSNSQPKIFLDLSAEQVEKGTFAKRHSRLLLKILIFGFALSVHTRRLARWLRKVASRRSCAGPVARLLGQP